MLESLDLPFVQRALAEVVLLAVGAGLIGTWIVLRGLAFHAHAVGTAAFPGLVLADGLGFAAPLGALGAAAVFGLAVAAFGRGRLRERDTVVALVLVGMLALGVILASNVFSSSAAVETLLFGSLLLIDTGDLALAGAVAGLAVAAGFLLGRHWVAAGFEDTGDAATRRPAWLERALFVLVALACAAALTAVGALLVAALFVLPAATTRLWFTRMRSWQLATVVLCVAEATAGVLVAVELNAPPGPVIAVIAGLAFAVAALARQVRRAGRVGSLARWAGAGAVAMILGGCGHGAGDRARVVATTPVVDDLVAQVADADLATTTILAREADPHAYEPSPRDVQALAGAELIFASGGDLDQWIEDAMDDAGSEAKLVVLADRVPHPLHGEHHHDHHDGEHDGDEPDPHWWHDPRNVAGIAPTIARALGELEPARGVAFERRAAALAREARSLDLAIRGCVGSIPAAQRKLVLDHDALAYFTRRYGLEVVGTLVPALTTQAQPSAGELAALRETIAAENVPAVFPDATATRELAEAVVADLDATVGAALYGDSIGPAGSPGATWQGATAANARAVTAALGGTCELEVVR